MAGGFFVWAALADERRVEQVADRFFARISDKTPKLLIAAQQYEG